MQKLFFGLCIIIPGLLMTFEASNTEAAKTFLASLTDSQKEKVLNLFNDKRSSWHYLPASMFERDGIFIRDLNKDQKALLQKLLQDYLSRSGYEKTQNIIELENVLRELGGGSYRDPEMYNVAFYGQPGKDKSWAWKFEGHHISLNFTVVADKISFSPRFFGANPAEVPSGSRKGFRALKKEEDIPLKLMESLNEAQIKQAVFRKKAYHEIISGNDSKAEALDDAGIRVKELTIEQRQLIMEIIMEYLSSVPEEIAKKRMQQVKKSNFNEIRFGWAGEIGLHKPHYYRIQGYKFLIELDNTQNNANHIHSVWRDFEGDFGRDLIKEHYKNSDHHHE